MEFVYCKIMTSTDFEVNPSGKQYCCKCCMCVCADVDRYFPVLLQVQAFELGSPDTWQSHKGIQAAVGWRAGGF